MSETVVESEHEGSMPYDSPEHVEKLAGCLAAETH